MNGDTLEIFFLSTTAVYAVLYNISLNVGI